MNLVEAGRSHILTNRLNGASGDASLREVRIQSGEGRPWDTKHSLSNTSAYIINGKAELNDYVGNVTWGAGVNALGVGEGMARMGAQYQSLFRKNGGFDDPRDQEAISFGYTLPLPSFRGSGASGSWDSGASGSWGASAGGGFLLYPNKSNLNTMRSVYRK